MTKRDPVPLFQERSLIVGDKKGADTSYLRDVTRDADDVDMAIIRDGVAKGFKLNTIFEMICDNRNQRRLPKVIKTTISEVYSRLLSERGNDKVCPFTGTMTDTCMVITLTTGTDDGVGQVAGEIIVPISKFIADDVKVNMRVEKIANNSSPKDLSVLSGSYIGFAPEK